MKLGGAGIAISALTQSDLAQRSVYAQNHGGGHHGGGHQGGVAPEIDAGAAVSALALLSGGALLLSDRFQRRRATQ